MTSAFKKTLVLILCIEAIFFIAPRFLNFEPGAVIVRVLGDLTNQERTSENLQALKVNLTLTKSAELKVKDMVDYGYFAHTSPEGRTPWYFLDEAGYKYQYAGENLAINFTNTEDVTAAWMKSPTHRANIEKSEYTEMGSAVATGTYLGREAVFVVQEYASPRSEEVQVQVEEKQPVQKVATVSENSGEVLGTTTSVSPVITPINEEKLKSDIVIPKEGSFNRVIIIILAGVVILLLINIFIKLGKHHAKLTEILLITIVIIILFFININYNGNKDEIYQGGIDYSHDQTVK